MDEATAEQRLQCRIVNAWNARHRGEFDTAFSVIAHDATYNSVFLYGLKGLEDIDIEMFVDELEALEMRTLKSLRNWCSLPVNSIPVIGEERAKDDVSEMRP